MKFNFKVGLSLIPLLSVAFADECTEIGKSLENVRKCVVNDEGKVIELDLSYTKLTTFPDTICNLESLEILDLSSNNIETLPENFSNLKKLKTLILEFNNFKVLPKSLFGLESLEDLNIASNENLSFIPVEIENLQNLKKLDLSFCCNLIKLPYEITKLQKLEDLDLTDAGIPVIPGFLTEIESLQSITIEPRSNGRVSFCVSEKLINSNTCRRFQNSGGTCYQYKECKDEEITLENYKNVTETVYIYNAFKNKCLHTTGLPDSSITYGACDNSDNSLWIVPNSHIGNYRSKANPDYCLSVEDGVVSLKECNYNVNIYRDVNFMKPLYDNYCIGSSKNNSATLKECDVNEPDQIWFFNKYDPSLVIEETPVVSEPENVTVYFYNAFKNECIHNDLTTGSCNYSEESLWEIPISHDGYYRSKADPEKCLSIVDGVVSLSECNENTVLYRDGNFIRSPSSDDSCIASSTIDHSLKYSEGCDMSNPDQIWYFNNWDPSLVYEETPVVSTQETVDVYFYNAYKNKCLRTTGLPDSSLTYGACDNSEDIVWTIPTSHIGNYRSKANPDYCLSIEDETVTLKECNETTSLYRDVNFIKSSLYENYCIGSSENNNASLKECDVNEPDQIWYFNNWDPSLVFEETPVVSQPESVTVYFYNAFKNECIHNDLTTGSCDFNDDSLWDIPVSHNGYYRSKADPEKCLSIVDGGLSLSECNENTVLYRDGNFIKSPLSDEYCIASSTIDHSLEYSEGCDISNPYQIWYFNNWTPTDVETTEQTTEADY